MKRKIKLILLYLLLFISFALIFGLIWVNKNFGLVSLDEIIFHLMVPIKGTNTSTVTDGIVNIGIPSIIFAGVLQLVLTFKYKYILEIEVKIKNKIFNIRAPRNIKAIICIVLFFVSLFFCIKEFELIDYVNKTLTKSSFIEENYVEPEDIELVFPENKRNLIYIFMESMESSYASEEEGGVLQHNLIPNLTNFANENISFSNSKKIGGAYTPTGTTWTVAAMVSHLSGIPLKIGFDRNSYGVYSTFLPGMTNLGDILHEEGYNQLFVLGSDIGFGGRDNLMSQHGEFEIFDYKYAITNGYYDDEDYVWWGFDDNHLYEFAKEQLTKLADRDKPFNFTLLTVDTHATEGYLPEGGTVKYNDKYSNVISHADDMIYEFVNWIKKQDFYENTTIVIVGDHLTMNDAYFEKYDKAKENRRVYNAYINSAVNADHTKDREFSTFDFFPTTLASMGVKIEGDKLGLGTNLFSNTKTLIEEYGIDYVNDELSKKSTYYNNKFLFNIEE